MRAVLAPRLEPPGGRDLALEGLRGLCALLVIYGHAFAPIPCLDPVYSPPDAFGWLEEARPAVLFFFILSGYVIGLTVKSPFSAPAAGDYLGRRLLRLVPVNTAAVLISWLLAPRTAPRTVLGNLFFLENSNAYFLGWRIPVMANDASLWTLNFELFYYILFLAVWRLCPRAFVFFALLALAVVAAACNQLPAFLACYAVGSLYWFAGLAVAWTGPKAEGFGNWPCALLVGATLWPLAPLEVLLSGWNLPQFGSPPMELKRLDLGLACLWLLLAVTGRSRRWQRILGLMCLTEATAALLVRFSDQSFGDKGEAGFVVYGGALVLGWVLLGWRPEPRWLVRMAPVGAISFGLYAVSLALQFGILGQHQLPAGTALSFTLRVALLLALSFGIAWLLERRLQPELRRRFNGRSRRAGEPPRKA